jgi:hypothetical protein
VGVIVKVVVSVGVSVSVSVAVDVSVEVTVEVIVAEAGSGLGLVVKVVSSPSTTTQLPGESSFLDWAGTALGCTLGSAGGSVLTRSFGAMIGTKVSTFGACTPQETVKTQNATSRSPAHRCF